VQEKCRRMEYVLYTPSKFSIRSKLFEITKKKRKKHDRFFLSFFDRAS